MEKWIALIFLFTLSCSKNYEPGLIKTLNNEPAVVGGSTVSTDDPVLNKVLSFKTFKDPKTTTEGNARFTTYSVSQCSASAIGPKIILTAAHCISKSSESFAHVGVSLPEGGTINYKVEKSVIHPDYKESDQTADLALVLLEAELPYDIEILELPKKSENLDLMSVEAAGFGRINGKQSLPGEIGTLRKTELDVIDYSPDAPNFHVDQTQGKGICQGDSGSPAMIEKNGKTYVVGVASKTIYLKEQTGEKDMCNYRGLYVNIQVYSDWITSTSNTM